MAAPGPGRQAEPAGGPADRDRHGRGRVASRSLGRRPSARVRRCWPTRRRPPATRSGSVAAARHRPAGLAGRGDAGRSSRARRPPCAGRCGRRPAAILVRAETSPDDVHGMARAAGILTSRGGLASHAAVVARGWGIPAVVGAAAIDVRDGRVVIGERILEAGDVITHRRPHRRGLRGRRSRGATEVVPEAPDAPGLGPELASTIGERRRRPRRRRSRRPTAAQARTVDARRVPAGDRDQGLRAARGRGRRRPGDDRDDVESLLDRLADRRARPPPSAGPIASPTRGRPAPTRSSRPTGRPGGRRRPRPLDAFLELDHRVKDIVTAWQMRDADAGRSSTTTPIAAYDAERPRPPGRAARRRRRLVHRRSRPGPPAWRTTGRASAGRVEAAAGRRRPLRRLTAGRQLPRHLVRAPRGPDPASPAGPARTRSPPAAPERPRASGPSRWTPSAVSLSQSAPALWVWM